MTIVEAWRYFQSHLIDEMAVSDDDDGKEAYRMVSDFLDSKIEEEKNADKTA
jgi:hypothetical protein